jgi:hypothetical protein
MNTAAWLPRRRAGTRQKTSAGTASRGIWFIRNANDLEGALRDLGAGAFADEMLVQDFVAGTTEKAQSVFCHGQMIGFHGYRQVMPGVGGGEAIKQSVRRPAVCAHLEKVGQALDWHGALSIDYIMPDDGGAALLIDCNPRLVEPFNAYRAAGCAEVSTQTRARWFWCASARSKEYSDDRGGGAWPSIGRHRPA